ncbi:hypothetical protein MAPG_01811 [Magnaporthiopsis poae ATCC 64411]|uniref:Uncharacterized protein n=1 Tax=Magnaporthiopsis poae (strain ATCC 64411 / 73-15) TaxID=644358 RepID=A0A0C4DPP0_MAGP6|nr:hypothetical protein MAPG_01811 [Magnaporthiopsis poae ATCC 64411]
MFRVANRSMFLAAKGGNGAGAAAESCAAAGAPVLQQGPGVTRAGIHADHHHNCTHGPAAPLAPLTSAGSVVESGPSLPRQTESSLVENANTPAASFPDGRCAYLTRPLPILPPRANVPTMASRPSTSGGLKAPPTFDSINDRRISRDDMFLKAPETTVENKRISRDDLFVGTRKQPGWTRPSLSVMPRVGPAQTLEISPSRPSPAITIGPVPQLERRGTFDSQMSGDIPIGMAIGSPTHIPSGLSNSWIPPQASPAPSPAAWPEPPPQPPAEPATLKRSKTGRRRLFSLFSRKSTPDEVKAVQAPEPPAVDFSRSMYVATAESTSSLSRSNTTANGKSSPWKFGGGSPAAVQTSPELFQQQSVGAQSSVPARSNPFEPDWRRRQKEMGVSGPLNLSAPPAAPSTRAGKGLLLDVEIPSIKMERYSVMFGSLLDAKRDSALLNRRQAAVEKLNAISDRVLAEQGVAKEAAPNGFGLARRTTSPQTIMESPIFPSSPAFAMFPTPPQSRPERFAGPAPSSPTARMRSNTSPANLPSPMQSTFGSDAALPRSQATAAPTRAFPMTQKVMYFGPGQSSLFLDSPTSPEDNADLSPRPTTQPQGQPPLKPSVPEPQWQMVTPPVSAAPSSTSSSSVGGRKRSPSAASSVRTNITKPSLEIEEPDSALKAAVEISIARQISVSRQQRNLLLPLHTAPNSTRQGTGTGAGAALVRSASPNDGGVVAASTSTSPVKLGKNERLVESVASTPTLVELPPYTSDSQLHNYRKSSRVVLEAA